MDFADAAAAAKRKGDRAGAMDFNRKAFAKEKRAAELVAESDDIALTRSVLHRSAAALALACEELDEAEILITRALSKRPSAEIAEELRDLLSDVYMHRHHSAQNVKLDDTQLQFSVEGNSIGHGLSPIGEFLPRIETANKLVVQAAQWVTARARSALDPFDGDYKSGLECYISPVRAGSLATTLCFGTNDETIPGMTIIPESINDLLDCLEHVDRENIVALKKQIENEEYFQSFIGLVKKIAPDGEKVRAVGFSTSDTARKKRTFVLTKEKWKLDSLPPLRIEDSPAKAVKIMGTLLEADARRKKVGSVQVVISPRKRYTVQIPHDDFDFAETVKSLFGERVIVSGIEQKKDVIICDGISRAKS